MFCLFAKLVLLRRTLRVLVQARGCGEEEVETIKGSVNYWLEQ
jgi:hypothetical protein